MDLPGEARAIDRTRHVAVGQKDLHVVGLLVKGAAELYHIRCLQNMQTGLPHHPARLTDSS